MIFLVYFLVALIVYLLAKYSEADEKLRRRGDIHEP